MSDSILFFSIGINFLPLIRAVARRGFTPVVHSQIAPMVQNAGIPFQVVEDFIPPDIQSHVEAQGRRLAGELNESLSSPEVREVFSSPRGDFLSVQGEGFLRELIGLVANEIVVLDTLEALTRHHHLSLFVMGCDNSPTERAVVEYASRRGIPTLQLAHAIYTRPLARIAAEHKLFSDSIAVYGTRAKEIMVEYGIEPERIFPTGSPTWDPFYTPEARLEKVEARRQLGLCPERPTLLYCSAYVDGSSAFYPAFSRRLMAIHRALAETALRLGEESQTVLRPHPNELARAGLHKEAVDWVDRTYLGRMNDSGLGQMHIVRSHKVESISASDLVLAVGSSSIIPEAMILQRPVVIAPWLEEEKLIYTEEDGVRVVHDEAELPDVIEDLLADPAKREEMVRRQLEVLPELNFGNDGGATERVAELAERLARRSPSLEWRAKPESLRRSKEIDGALRLLFVAHTFLPYGLGGTERYTRDMAYEMRRRGHEVRVLYPRYLTDDPRKCSIRESQYEELPVVEVLTSKNAFSLIRNEALKPLLKSYLQENPVDVVHAQHLMGLSVAFVEVLDELSIPLVFTANDFWFMCQQIHLVSPEGTVCAGPDTMDKCVQCMVRRMGNATEEQLPQLFHYMAERYFTQRRTMRALELVLCPSRFLMEAFQRYEFLGANAIHAPQGVSLFTPLERPERPVPPVKLAYIGTVDYRKGTDLAVEAFNRVETEGAELHIYGNVAHKEYFDKVMQSVLPGKTVAYHGEYTAEDLPGILASVDVALVPSRGENYPFVIREILNARVPVIASRVAGIPEIVKDGVNGLIFAGSDVGDFASKLEMVIKSPELIESLREGIEPVKSIEQDAEEIEGHYLSLLGRVGGSRPASDPAFYEGRQGLEPVEAPASRQVSGSPSPRACSIVIVTYNSASTIRTCLDTVLSASGPSSEVIVVDNASADETISILAEYEGRIKTILNDRNAGFSRGCNQGIEASSGEYVVLLNPDTAVTPGWVERMAAHFAPDVGAVGPISNYVVAKQHVGRYMPDERKGDFGLAYLAELLYESNRGRSVETKLLVGFCMMFPRRVLDEVGMLDEELFLGNDDLDISWRLRQAGYRLLIATDTFVYHEGQASFKTEDESKTSALVQQSTDLLYKKLEAHYGAGNVPHPMELWDMDWFKPYRARFRTKPKDGEPPLTSIIILTHNELNHTKLCLASIEANTPEPHELIIVDNGSSDGTVEFLREYVTTRPDVRVVANKSNRGFAAGNNMGMALAKGDFVLLINNDTIVTRGWLGRMLAVFSRHENAGVVGPMSNYVSGPQLIAEASYGNQAEMESFAARLAEENSGLSEPIMRVVGFCLLTRRDVVERIGGLDERFGSGNFEDDDFCIRAALVGYEARIAKDVFIHHAGSQTFKGAKIDYQEAMERNWGVFKAKWGIPAETPMQGTYHLPPQLPEEAGEYISLPDLEKGHRPEQGGRWWQEAPEEESEPRVRAGFIRGGPELEEAVESVRRFNGDLEPLSVWADAGAINDELARSEYLVLAAPDVIFTKGWLETMLAVAESDANIAAVGPTSNTAPEPQQVKADYKSLKKALQKFASKRSRRHKEAWEEVPYLGGFCLLIRCQAVRYVGGLDAELPLSEGLWDLYGRLHAEGFRLACALGAYVHHSELTEDEGSLYDEKALGGDPAPEVLDEAQAALERGDIESAAALFGEAARRMPGLASAHWAYGSTMVALERMDEGVKALRRAAELAPDEAALQNQLGVVLYQAGEAEEARRAFETALEGAPGDVDVLLNLVELCRDQGLYTQATEHLKEAQRFAPVDAGVLSALGAISMELGDLETAQKALQHLEAVEPGHPEIQPLRHALEGGLHVD